MPIIAAPSFWTSLSIVLPLACLGALAWLRSAASKQS